MGFKVATDHTLGLATVDWMLIPGSDVNLALFTPPGHENRIGGFNPSLLVRRRLCDGRASEVKRGELAAEQEGSMGNDGQIQRSDGNEFVFSSR